MSKPRDLNRRQFIRTAGLLGLAGAAGGATMAEATTTALQAGDTITLPFAHGERKIAQYPGKKPLILLTSDALQLETPLSMFDDNIITPNDAFFVRYHNTKIPLSIDPNTYRISVSGNVTTPLSLSISDLKTKFTGMEVVAVNSCTGNSRGFNKPRVPGGQWAHGAMGNARWTGVSLKEILVAAGVGVGALQVVFDGLDRADESGVPDFVKALNVDMAMSNDVMLAYAMNGADLPMLNGYPVRLIVPGYTGTYWVKHLSAITVVNTVFSGFYMSTAYREPDNDCACVPPGTAPTSTRPVTRPRIRSFITNLVEGAMVQSGTPALVKGFAFDGGSGIKNVFFSSDNGLSWQESTLGQNLGKYSFRSWQIPFTAQRPGAYALKVKAVATSGETQPETQFWAPTGYGYNSIETVNVVAL